MEQEINEQQVPDSRNWDHDIAALLATLSTTQGELLELLVEKKKLLGDADTAGLAEIQPREAALIEKLQACHDQRASLLEVAQSDGLPCGSIRELAGILPEDQQSQLKGQFVEAESRSRLLQHHSLTNWVLVQRTLIHLSQILEIIATGGRLQPTYGKGKQVSGSGSLVDHAA